MDFLLAKELLDFEGQWGGILFKVLASLACGGIIGWERERKNKPAGLRTNILICIGATLFTIVSVAIAEAARKDGYIGIDPGRIAAQIVTGVGFLGGGMIIQSRGSVSGLTSAATVWAVAAIGICVGIGYTMTGALFTAIIFFTLHFMAHVDRKIFGKIDCYHTKIFVSLEEAKCRASVAKVFSYMDIEIEEFEVTERKDYCLMEIVYLCPEQLHLRIQAGIWSVPGVQRVEAKAR